MPACAVVQLILLPLSWRIVAGQNGALLHSQPLPEFPTRRRDTVIGLSELLAGAVPAGAYRWPVPGSTRRSDVDDAAAKAGWRLYWLAGQEVTDQQELLQLCADTFAFPDWFGCNWDALYDCLTDLTWENPSAGHLVIYAGWQALAQ